MKFRIIFLFVCLLTFGSIAFAQSKTKTINTPEQVVKNLYAARKSPKTDPFFQTKSRALLDKYFTKNFADLIWKDATTRGDGVGALDFDPLEYAQDSEITNFIIEKADENGVVKVKFKNFGKDEEIKFFLTKENTASKVWKIDSIVYSDAEDLGSIIEYGMMSDEEMKAAESENKLDGDYMVGTVKCNITTNISGYWARVKCDDQENFQIVDTETMTFGTFNPNEKGRKGHFVSPEYGVIEKFVDASGKEFKVTKLEKQPKVCGLNLEITETNANGLPIQNAAATATNTDTNETVKATLFEAMPVFSDLREGKYKISVMKNGYKNLVKEVELNCNNLTEDDQSATEYIFLIKGK